MTVIVGVAHQGQVYIGGDSAGFIEGTILYHSNGKVFRNGEFVCGSAGKRRFSEIVRFSFKPPRIDSKDLDAYMATKFIDALRKALRKGGYLKTDDGQEGDEEDAMLVGVRGELFYVCGSLSASSISGGAFAVGAGGDFALGALFATPRKPPEERILIAMQAAEKHSDGVRGPFHIESTEDAVPYKSKLRQGATKKKTGGFKSSPEKKGKKGKK